MTFIVKNLISSITFGYIRLYLLNCNYIILNWLKSDYFMRCILSVLLSCIMYFVRLCIV